MKGYRERKDSYILGLQGNERDLTGWQRCCQCLIIDLFLSTSISVALRVFLERNSSRNINICRCGSLCVGLARLSQRYRNRGGGEKEQREKPKNRGTKKMNLLLVKGIYDVSVLIYL